MQNRQVCPPVEPVCVRNAEVSRPADSRARSCGGAIGAPCPDIPLKR